jgi:hypothetical protein
MIVGSSTFNIDRKMHGTVNDLVYPPHANLVDFAPPLWESVSTEFEAWGGDIRLPVASACRLEGIGSDEVSHPALLEGASWQDGE